MHFERWKHGVFFVIFFIYQCSFKTYGITTDTQWQSLDLDRHPSVIHVVNTSSKLMYAHMDKEKLEDPDLLKKRQELENTYKTLIQNQPSIIKEEKALFDAFHKISEDLLKRCPSSERLLSSVSFFADYPLRSYNNAILVLFFPHRMENHKKIKHLEKEAEIAETIVKDVLGQKASVYLRSFKTFCDTYWKHCQQTYGGFLGAYGDFLRRYKKCCLPPPNNWSFLECLKSIHKAHL